VAKHQRVIARAAEKLLDPRRRLPPREVETKAELKVDRAREKLKKRGLPAPSPARVATQSRLEAVLSQGLYVREDLQPNGNITKATRKMMEKRGRPPQPTFCTCGEPFRWGGDDVDVCSQCRRVNRRAQEGYDPVRRRKVMK
jgi:hypothetical protein